MRTNFFKRKEEVTNADNRKNRSLSKNVVNFYDYCKVYQKEKKIEEKLKETYLFQRRSKEKDKIFKHVPLQMEISNIQQPARQFRSSLHNYHQSSAQQQIVFKIKERHIRISHLSSTVLSDLSQNSNMRNTQVVFPRGTQQGRRVYQLEKLRKCKKKIKISEEKQKYSMTKRQGECPIEIVKKYCQEG